MNDQSLLSSGNTRCDYRVNGSHDQLRREEYVNHGGTRVFAWSRDQDFLGLMMNDSLYQNGALSVS